MHGGPPSSRARPHAHQWALMWPPAPATHHPRIPLVRTALEGGAGTCHRATCPPSEPVGRGRPVQLVGPRQEGGSRRGPRLGKGREPLPLPSGRTQLTSCAFGALTELGFQETEAGRPGALKVVSVEKPRGAPSVCQQPGLPQPLGRSGRPSLCAGCPSAISGVPARCSFVGLANTSLASRGVESHVIMSRIYMLPGLPGCPPRVSFQALQILKAGLEKNQTYPPLYLCAL